MERSAWQAGKPVVVSLRRGERWQGCGCGRSTDPPRCDRGSDAGCRVLVIEAERDRILWLCGCDRSAAAPLCDGSHKRAVATVRPA